MTARRKLADIQGSHHDQVYLTLCFDITPWTLRLWRFCLLGLFGVFLVDVFCSVTGKVFVFQNAVPVTNLIVKVPHKEHVHIYRDGIYMIQFFSTNQVENTQKYNKHCNTTCKGFVYFWFTNKGTQYFCLCLIKAHGFSICFQTFVPTAEKNITGKHTFFFLVPNLNTSYC